VRAGTLIFATSVIVWALGYFPSDRTENRKVDAQIAEWKERDGRGEELDKLDEALKPELENLALLEAAVDPEKSNEERTASLHSAVEKELIAEASPDLAEKAAKEIRTRIEPEKSRSDALHAELDPMTDQLNHLNGVAMERSYLGRMGHFIEPAVKPLGWDWKIGVGAIASFPAREVIVATLGTIYSLGSDVDEENEGLRGALKSEKWPDGTLIFTPPVALSVMVFFALCAQCAATLMIIKRETNSWAWPLFTFTYMTALAYVGAFLTYQVGKLLV